MKAIIVHGGAGQAKDPSEVPGRVDFMKEVASKGYELLNTDYAAADVAVEVVKMLEDNPYFDAGRGSYLNEEGFVEMDAGIMDGSTLCIGAVGAVQNIKNPIVLAKLLMEDPKTNFLVGEGAEKFARERGIELVPPYYFYTDRIIKLYENMFSDTVGAVVFDGERIVSAVSTGGTSGKRVGRVGDSPLVGSGFYANDSFGAVSTGVGEEIMKVLLSFRPALYYPEHSLEEAVSMSLDDLNKVNGHAGMIALDKFGNIAFSYNTQGMFRAYMKDGQDEVVAGF
jgi:beta-aspartyl-peptidase (threonine type)